VTTREAIGWALLAAMAAGCLYLFAQAPWQLLLPAAVPPLATSALLLAWARPPRWHWRALLGALLWGIVAAPALSAGFNEVGLALMRVAGWSEAKAIAAVAVAPQVEELCKAAGVVLVAAVWRGALRGLRDGIVLGALVGIGFTIGENLHYLAFAVLSGGSAGLLEGAYLRGALGGLLHPTFAAASGAGLGAGRRAPAPAWRIALPLIGVLAAIVQHLAWNAVGADWLRAAPCGPAAASCALGGELRFALLVAPAIVLPFVMPGVVLLAYLARREAGRATPEVSPARGDLG
jgi:RsiW-degrading membrane proteinase PrsW (M82 family)